MNKFILPILLFPAMVLLGSCSDGDAAPELPADADDNFITALSLSVDNATYDATIEGQDITVAVPYNATLTCAVATIVYTPSATLNPDPENESIDWNREQVFTVTSYKGAPREYTYRIAREEITEKGDVALRTMAEIAAFRERGTSVVEGDLTIGTDQGEEISSVEGLSHLKSVAGNLILKNSFRGFDLTGLEQLTEIGGLEVGTQENPSSAQLEHAALPKLTRVAGSISIWNNNVQWVELTSLTRAAGIAIASEKIGSVELPALTEVDDDLIVEGCLEREFAAGGTSGYDPPMLKGDLEVFSMPNLRRVGGRLAVNFIAPLKTIALPRLAEAGSIDCEYLPMAFETFDFGALQSVGEGLKLCSVKTVQTIGGYVTYNDALTTLGDLSQLERIGGVLTLMNFGALTDISLPALTQSGGIRLEGLARIATLSLPRATFTAPAAASAATIGIAGCPALEKIAAPATVDAILQIDLTQTNGVPAFENATTIAGADLTLTGALSQDLTFANWQKVEGDFSLIMNVTKYTNKIGLPDMQEVGGYLNISWKKTAPNFRPTVSMPALKTVGGQLQVIGLVTGYDFSSLETVCCSEAPAYVDQAETTPPIGSVNLRIQTGGAAFPALTRVGGKGLAIQGGSTLSCPLLTRLDGTLILNAYKGSEVEMPRLERLGGVYFYKATALSDFTFFGKFIENGDIAAENWTVTGCGYDPSFEDMQAGRYTNP